MYFGNAENLRDVLNEVCGVVELEVLVYSVVGVVAVLVVASEVCGVVGLEVLLYFVVRAVVVNVVTTVVGDIGFVVAAAVVVVVLGVSVVGSGRTKHKECY